MTPLLSPESCASGRYRRDAAAVVGAAEGVEAGDEWCALCPAGTVFVGAATAGNSSDAGAGAGAAAREAIVGILACVACPSGHVSGPGAVRCVSCGAVYNSNSAGTACEVRWYVYVGGALAVAALAFTLATAQTLFRFGNRQVERLMWQAREARRLALEKEKKRRERAVEQQIRMLGGGGGGGSFGGGGRRDSDSDSSDIDSDSDDELSAVKQEVAMTLDMVLAVRPARHCSPRRRMPFHSTNEGSKCVG